MELDFVEVLAPDIALEIFKCLDHPADIIRAGAVSRSWRDFVMANSLCKHLCLKLFPQLSNIARFVDVNDRRARYGGVGCSRSVGLGYAKFEQRAYISLARCITSSRVDDCPLDAISASSTDNYPEESIQHTLEPRDRVGQRALYWSSSGQSNHRVSERLTYKLLSDMSVITDIYVQPFQAYFQPNSPIYSAKAVRFRMGYLLNTDDGQGYIFTDAARLPSAEENFVWTYTSPEYPMVQENRLQKFKLPKPVLCMGGLLQVELLGGVQKQEVDDLFYICVSHVRVMGISLAPVFRIHVIDSAGKVTLLYNPAAHFDLPIQLPEDLNIVTPEMVHSHVKDWRQILSVLHRAANVEGYDAEDEHHESDGDVSEELAL